MTTAGDAPGEDVAEGAAEVGFVDEGWEDCDDWVDEADVAVEDGVFC